MDAAEILAECGAVGIVLEIDGNRLILDAPIGGLKSELRDAIAANKSALMEAIAPPVSESTRLKLVVCNFCTNWAGSEGYCTAGETVPDPAVHSCSRWSASERWLGHQELGRKFRSLASNDDNGELR